MAGMKENVADALGRPRTKVPFCCIGNEVFDFFLPIMEAECFTVYATSSEWNSTNSETQTLDPGISPEQPNWTRHWFPAPSKSWSTCDW